MQPLQILHLLLFGVTTYRLSCRKTLLPCRVGVVHALGMRVSASENFIGLNSWNNNTIMKYSQLKCTTGVGPGTFFVASFSHQIKYTINHTQIKC